MSHFDYSRKNSAGCEWCHLLSIRRNASSHSIYTPHRTRLRKMPLFPMITFWQHTEMSWPHPIVWFPVVIQFHIKSSMITCFCLFVHPPFFFCWKTWICTEINHANHRKAQLLTHFYNKTKTRKTSKHFFVYVVWKVDERWSGMMIRSLDVLYHGCVLIRGQKKNPHWSSRLAVLHCE